MPLPHGGPLPAVTHEQASLHVLDSIVSLSAPLTPAALDENSDHRLGHMTTLGPGRMNGSDWCPL